MGEASSAFDADDLDGDVYVTPATSPEPHT